MVYRQRSSVVSPSIITTPAPHIEKYPFLVETIIDNRISAPHWHNYMQIWYTVSGEYYHTINGVRKKQTAGSVALVFPFSVHSIDSSVSDLSKTRVVSVSVYKNLLLENNAPYSPLTFSTASFDKCLLYPFVNLCGKEKELCDELCEKLVREYSLKENMSSKKILNSVLSMLDLCARSINTVLRPHEVTKLHDRFEIIAEATAALHGQSLPDNSLDSMCKYVFMSKRQFTDKFRETTGQTFGTYSKLLRLSRATNLLRYSQKSLTEIAVECGFTTRSYYINECTSAYGVSPLILKRQMIEDDKMWGEHLYNISMEKFGWRMSLSESDKYEWKMYALGKA